MSISGLFLILFLLIHVTVNSLSLISPEAFEKGCEFMALPVITVIVPILALGFIIHIIYATVLTLGNLKARGNMRYAVPHKGASDSLAAKNMFVLGIIVLGVLVFHLTHFWADMQLQEWMGNEPTDPNELLAGTFGSPLITVIYIIWFAALWFHLTHGFWSAIHTLGWNNDIWFNRWKTIAKVYATILCLGFAFVAIWFGFIY